MNSLIRNTQALVFMMAVLFGASTTMNIAYAEQTKQEKNKKEIIEVPVVVMIPLKISKKLKNEMDCWVELYDEKNFEGDSLLLVGPIEKASMVSQFGFDWSNNVSSVITGPNANLTIFNALDFQNEDKFIESNKNIPDLSEKMGYFDNFRSLILTCPK